MRFVSVRELRGKSAAIWKELAQEQEMVITSNGKPIAFSVRTTVAMEAGTMLLID